MRLSADLIFYALVALSLAEIFLGTAFWMCVHSGTLTIGLLQTKSQSYLNNSQLGAKNSGGNLLAGHNFHYQGII